MSWSTRSLHRRHRHRRHPPPVNRGNTSTKTLDQLFTETMVPILFDYDKATIRPAEESKLLNNAAWLKQNPTVKFQIEGHADERGSQEYNIALGDERAAAVKKFWPARVSPMPV
jgi:peptidoglycan-associated lipoprotein